MRQSARSYVWAQGSAPDGERVEGWIETMEAIALRCGGLRAGGRAGAGDLAYWLGPPAAQALGADFVLTIPQMARYDALEGAS